MRETPPEATGTGSAASPAPGRADHADGPGGAVLACYDVTKSYGAVRAVDSVSMEVPRQGLFGLCGFDGAGKSTLFNLLAGSVRADSGSVRIDGRDATGWSAMRRARFGVARTWQTVRLARVRGPARHRADLSRNRAGLSRGGGASLPCESTRAPLLTSAALSLLRIAITMETVGSKYLLNN